MMPQLSQTGFTVLPSLLMIPLRLEMAALILAGTRQSVSGGPTFFNLSDVRLEETNRVSDSDSAADFRCHVLKEGKMAVPVH